MAVASLAKLVEMPADMQPAAAAQWVQTRAEELCGVLGQIATLSRVQRSAEQKLQTERRDFAKYQAHANHRITAMTDQLHAEAAEQQRQKAEAEALRQACYHWEQAEMGCEQREAQLRDALDHATQCECMQEARICELTDRLSKQRGRDENLMAREVARISAVEAAEAPRASQQAIVDETLELGDFPARSSVAGHNDVWGSLRRRRRRRGEEEEEEAPRGLGGRSSGSSDGCSCELARLREELAWERAARRRDSEAAEEFRQRCRKHMHGSDADLRSSLERARDLEQVFSWKLRGGQAEGENAAEDGRQRENEQKETEKVEIEKEQRERRTHDANLGDDGLSASRGGWRPATAFPFAQTQQRKRSPPLATVVSAIGVDDDLAIRRDFTGGGARGASSEQSTPADIGIASDGARDRQLAAAAATASLMLRPCSDDAEGAIEPPPRATAWTAPRSQSSGSGSVSPRGSEGDVGGSAAVAAATLWTERADALPASPVVSPVPTDAPPRGLVAQRMSAYEQKRTAPSNSTLGGTTKGSTTPPVALRAGPKGARVSTPLTVGNSRCLYRTQKQATSCGDVDCSTHDAGVRGSSVSR
eukprot:TRINITY_DN31531_c0_g1_i1.p1 TRINITY_DN31531_c0_g1~~TRINITY_DN31531_c0_g1_i1.p1  ORF type:complete len:634 (-),score=120.58 TRINITY_DN31531_c0_g1_i1:410-2182(-)